jgi:dienelactone hydrolase
MLLGPCQLNFGDGQPFTAADPTSALFQVDNSLAGRLSSRPLGWMRSLPEIDSERLGVLGQSEGADIAFMLAAGDSGIRFLVWQEGTYNDIESILKWQAEAFWKLESVLNNNMKQGVPLIYWLYRQNDELIVGTRRGEKYFQLGDEDWLRSLSMLDCCPIPESGNSPTRYRPV